MTKNIERGKSFMGKIKQNTSIRQWAGLWLVMALAVMTALFLRGGITVQAEESDTPLSIVNSIYTFNDEDYYYEYDLPDLSVGDELTFRVETEGGSGNLTYQWYSQISNDDGDDFTPIEGQVKDSLTVSKKEKSTEVYYCEVKDDAGNGQGTYFYIPSIKTLTIKSYINDEEDNTIEAEENDSIKLRIEAQTTEDESKLTYVWYDADGNELSETGNEITVIKKSGNEEYSCAVSDGVNSGTYTFYLNEKNTVIINNASYIMNGKTYDSEYDLPDIVVGDEITLSVEAESSVSDMTYQWYYRRNVDEDDYDGYEKVSGATQSTLKIKKSNLEREQYYCEVSDTKNSNRAYFEIPTVQTLTIRKYINGEEQVSMTFRKGDDVTMKVDAVSTLGNDKITYQWYDSSDEQIEGATNATYTIKKATGYEGYYCMVTDTLNTTSCYFSLETENTISDLKQYINDKQEYSISNAKAGKQYKLRVEPVSKNKDAVYTYSWYIYNNDGEREIVGENSPEIEITKTKKYSDIYYIDVKSDDGSTINTGFYLNRKFDLSILAYVNGEYCALGDSDWVSYSVDADKESKLYVDAKSDSGKDITYQWGKYNDIDDDDYEIIDNATDATYTAVALESDSEEYVCIITCDEYIKECKFRLNKKGSRSDRPDPDISQYVIVDGKKVEQDDTTYVDKGSKVTLGVKVSELPDGIKEEDIRYEWYEEGEDNDTIVCREREYTIPSVSESKAYYCRFKVNDELLVNWSVGFNIEINPDVTAEISVDGKKVSTLEVDSFEELYDKKATITVADKTNPNAKFTYEWFKINQDGKEDERISTTSECTLKKDFLSDYEVDLYCVITDENGNTQTQYLILVLNDYSDSGEKYINDENTDEGQFKTGDKVTLRVGFPDGIADKLTYQWYDTDWKKIDNKDAKYVVTKGDDEENYTCLVTDQYGRNMSYDFTLYPETKLVPQRYINGKKLNTNYCYVSPGAAVKLEVKTASNNGVSYQWYKGEYKGEELKGKTESVLSVKASEEVSDEDCYKCLITRGNERQWVYFFIYSCSHRDTEVIPAVAATCEKNGLTEGKRCKECGETLVEQIVVKAVGHKWDNGTVTTPATTTATGVKTFTCTVCKKTKTEVIPKLTAKPGDTTKPAQPDKKPGNTTTKPTQPNKKPATKNTTLKTGTKVTDKKSKASYKVTEKKTVQYTATTNKKAAKVTVPSTVTVKGVKYQVTSIAANAFKNNKKLKTVVIPASVRSIGKQAFAGCKNLKKITIKTPYLTKKSVGAKAFKGIAAKATIKVPKKQLKAYKKLLKTKGIGKKVKIK